MNHYLVILRGPLPEASASVDGSKGQIDVTGTPITLTLTNDAPPIVTVFYTPTLHASIVFGPGVKGPFDYIEQPRCQDQQGISGGQRGWEGESPDDLSTQYPTDCIAKREWMAYAGYLNHAVGEVEYSSL